MRKVILLLLILGFATNLTLAQKWKDDKSGLVKGSKNRNLTGKGSGGSSISGSSSGLYFGFWGGKNQMGLSISQDPISVFSGSVNSNSSRTFSSSKENKGNSFGVYLGKHFGPVSVQVGTAWVDKSYETTESFIWGDSLVGNQKEVISKVDRSLTYLRSHLAFRYDVLAGPLTPYLKAGIQYDSYLKGSSTYRQGFENNAEEFVVTRVSEDDIAKAQMRKGVLGLQGSAGLGYTFSGFRFFIEGRYNQAFQDSNASNLSSTIEQQNYNLPALYKESMITYLIGVELNL